MPEHETELNAYAALIVDDAPGFTPEGRRELAAWVTRGGVVLLTLGPRGFFWFQLQDPADDD